MAEFGELARWFTFTSDRFDHSSELPAEYNAGNRFYGRDVAEFVSGGLGASGLESSFFDEDWGWLVHAGLPDDGVLEVAVYHNPEADPATESNWALMVRSLRKERWLGVIPRLRERELDPRTVATLEDVFAESGILLRLEEQGA